jgi:hypothetical protein
LPNAPAPCSRATQASRYAMKACTASSACRGTARLALQNFLLDELPRRRVVTPSNRAKPFVEHLDGIAIAASIEQNVGSPSARVRVCAREEQPAEEPRGRSIPSAVGRAAEGSAGLQVEHQLVLRRRLHRKVGWVLASKDAVNVVRSSPNYHQDGSSARRAGRAILDCMPGVQSSQGQTAVRSGRSLYIGRSIAGDGERNSILAQSLASVLSGEGGTT